MVYATINAGYSVMTPADAAQAIADRALAMLKTTDKIIVAMGENHGPAIHQLVQALTLIELKDKGLRPALAVELPDNTLPLLLQNRLQCTPHEAQKIAAYYREAGMDSSLAVSGILGYGEETDGLRLLLHTARRHDIPVHLVDAARQFNAAANKGTEQSRSPFLDLRDETALSAAKKLEFPPALIAQNRLDIHETRGMYLRNRVMAERSKALLSSTQTDIVVLNTGQRHLFGDSKGPHPKAYSLSAQFGKQLALLVSLSHKEPSDGRLETNAMHIHPDFGKKTMVDLRAMMKESGLPWSSYNPDAPAHGYKDELRNRILMDKLSHTP